jgi:hypothetical protein
MKGDTELKNINNLNKRLLNDVFCLPVANLLVEKDIEDFCNTQNSETLIKKVIRKTMSPHSRIMQLISRYRHLQEYQQTNSFIISALRSYYFGEHNVAQIVLLLCIESVLCQWLTSGSKFNKNSWGKWKINAEKILNNAPTDHIKDLLRGYIEVCDKYLNIFFARATQPTPASANGFNRPQVAHFLHNTPVNEENITRVCLFLDIIADLIYCEKNKYEEVSKFTYFDSVLDNVNHNRNQERLRKYDDLEADFMSCGQADTFRKAMQPLNKNWLKSIR